MGGLVSGGRKSAYGVGLKGSSSADGPSKCTVSTPVLLSTDASNMTERPLLSRTALPLASSAGAPGENGTATPLTSAPVICTDDQSRLLGRWSVIATLCAAALAVDTFSKLIA